MTRQDYLNDPAAPKATHIVPATSAIITNRRGKILLHKRRDNQLWALPGGTMEPGESVADCLKREVKEETGLEIEPLYIVGIYSNPQHVISFRDGEVRQEFSICFKCRILSGQITLSDESEEIKFFSRDEIGSLMIHLSIRQRIHDYWSRKRSIFS